jgi:FkbM family methyltransferase
MIFDSPFILAADSAEAPVISVLSANKNHGRYIEQNIVSVLLQAGVTFEYILIEGGSTDLSLDIIAKYPKLICKVAPELSATEAYHEALRMARGRYIMVTTSTDGYLGSDWFRTAAAILDADPELSLVWANCQYMGQDGLLGNIAWADYFNQPPPQRFDLFHKFINTPAPNITYLPELNYCVRKDVFIECFNSNEADEDFHELRDINQFVRFLFKFLQRGYLAHYVNVVANFGRTHHDQYSQKLQSDGDMSRYHTAYHKALERYRARLLSGQPHLFRNGEGEVIQRYNWPVIVFDVGANIGVKAANFAAHENVRVVCFEPVPECLQRLEERFSDNPLVTIVPAALGATAGSLPLSICSGATILSTFSEAWKGGRFKDYTWDRAIEAPMRTLDSAIAEFGLPDYCKIDVEGFESKVLQGLSQPIPVVSFEFCNEGLVDTSACIQKLTELGYRRFNVVFGEGAVFRYSVWTSGAELLSRLERHTDPLCWGDVYASSVEEIPSRLLPLLPAAPESECLPRLGADTFEVLSWRGQIYPGVPVRLHLGCGEHMLSGYINIDYPPEQHKVTQVQPDLVADITALSFPDGSLDEIRLHHVFEHFNRVIALGFLIRWHRWLKIGGTLHIETPDFEEEARAFLAPRQSFSDRMAAIRSLEGDQTAPRGYHVGQWFAERFEHSLIQLGFVDIAIQHGLSGRQPPLHNLTVRAARGADRSLDEQLSAADALLWNSIVAEAERPTYDIWRQQLRQMLAPELGEAAAAKTDDLALLSVRAGHAVFDGRERIELSEPPPSTAGTAAAPESLARISPTEVAAAQGDPIILVFRFWQIAKSIGSRGLSVFRRGILVLTQLR